MFPILYTIGPFNVYSFGVLLGLAFIVSTFAVWKVSRDELKEEEYLDAYLSACIAALVAARGTYIMTHLNEFGTNVLAYVLVRHTPGLSLFGGLFGSFVFLWWYCRKKKLRFLHTADMFSTAFSLAVFFAKIGEQLGGGSFGRETNTFPGVHLVGKTGRFHPVELYEAFLFLMLAIVSSMLYGNMRKWHFRDGFVSQVFSLGAMSIIFALEFLKVSDVYLYHLSIRQIAVVLAMLFVSFPLAKTVYARFRFTERSNV